MKANLHTALLALIVAAAAHSDEVVVDAWRNAFSSADTFLFTGMFTGNTYVWVGTDGDVFDSEDAWAVWASADGSAANGINQTGDYFRTADAANQKTRLLIGSGSYTFPSVQLGKEGTSHVVVTGGVLRASNGDVQVGINGGDSTFVISNGTVSAAYWLTAGRDAATTSRIEMHGGTLTTAFRDGVEQTGNTGNGMIDLASHANSRTTFLQTGGRVHAAGSANKYDTNIAMSVGNGSGAEAVVELTGGEMDLDGHMEVPRLGKGAFTLGGGTLDVSDELHIAAGDSSDGAFTVTGGVAAVHSFVQVGRGGNSIASLAVKDGELTVDRYIAVGFGAGSSAEVSVSGGSVAMNGSVNGIGFLIGDNAAAFSSVMNVSGGKVYANADSYVGWNSPGILNISGDGYVAVGSASVHKWLKLNNFDAVTGLSRINLDGGVLDICHIKIEKASGTGEVNFNGGTLRGYANNSYANGNLFGESAQLTVNVKAGGATIEVPGGVSVSVGEPLLADAESQDGGFTKTGFGTLTLAQGNTYTGATRVMGGTLSLPDGAFGETLGALELGGGALAGSAYEWPSVTVVGGTYDFASLPIAADGHYTVSGGAIRVSPDESLTVAPSTNIVVKGGMFVIDVSGHEVVEDETRITFSHVAFDGVDPAEAVKFTGTAAGWSISDNGDGSYTATAGAENPTNRWIGGESGDWQDPANWQFGVPFASQTAVFDSPATVFMDANRTVAELQVDSTVRFQSADIGSIHPAILFSSISGSGTIQLAHVGLSPASGVATATVADAVTLEYVKANDDNSSDSWLGGSAGILEVRGRIAGEGYVRLYNNTRLYGDNSSFTGKVKKDNGDVRFMTAQSGFANAAQFDLSGTLWIWFASGTISFGGNVTMATYAEEFNRNIACGINVPNGIVNVEIVFGGGDGDVVLKREWHKGQGADKWNWYPNDPYAVYVEANGWTRGSDKVTIRKIGSGTLSLDVDGAYNLAAQGGVTTIVADHSSAVVSVAAGAAISAGNISVASLVMAEGAVFVPVVTYTAAVDAVADDPETEADESAAAVPATWSVAPLRVAGTASVEGMVVRIDAPENLIADNTYTLIAADAVDGAPSRVAVDADGNRMSALAGEVWLVRKIDNDVVLVSGPEYTGFMIRIR